jgi:tRNA threonylcarbamoyladenosine biosynthesis protein TsaB
MTILALEFSSDRRGVALLRDGRLLAEVSHEGTRHTPIFALITRALAEAGLARGDVEAIAVGIGPGSYTGIRFAISVAQGWQLATGAQTMGVNSLENMALVAAERGPVLLAVDAQRGEFAVASAEAGRLLEPVRLVPATELRERLARGETIAGPDVPRLLGDGFEVHATAANAACMAWARPDFVPAEQLAAVYLREASFVKAPPARVLGLEYSA